MNFDKKVKPAFEPENRHRFRLWVFVRSKGKGTHLVLFWRRIFVVLLVLAILGWFGAAAGALMLLRQRHPDAPVRYLNLVFPHRWSEHRRSLGEHYLKLAMDPEAKHLPSEKVRLLAAGLSRSPNDLAARQQLAILYARFGNLNAAINVLLSHIDVGIKELDYLRFTFSALFELQRNEEVLKITSRHLPTLVDGAIHHNFLALQAATANYNLGRYDQAEKIARTWEIERSVEGLLLLARCDWERGFPELARMRVERGRVNFPTRDEIPLFLVRLYRELGQPARAHQESLVRVTADPLSPGPRIDLIHSLHQMGDQPAFRREIELFFRDFGKDPRALGIAANLAATLSDVLLAQETLARARIGNFPIDEFRITLLSTYLAAEMYSEARLLAEDLQSSYPIGTPFGNRIAGWRAVACLGVRDRSTAELCLKTYTGETYINNRESMVIATALERLNEVEPARQVLNAAIRRNPLDQAAVTQIVRLESNRRNIESLELHLPRLISFGKPSRRVLEEATYVLDESTPARAALLKQVKEKIAQVTDNPEPGF
ncbi:MAG: hypothetical protein Q8M02_10765 [Candidatus Didemnitutus sp.]|nr:hypothetical protein [Candidatus Didemnitutus sp.]